MKFTRDEIDTAIKDIEKELAWASRFTIDKTTGYARSLIIAIKVLKKLKEEVCDREIRKKLYGADMTVLELIERLQELNQSKSISFFAPDGQDEIEFEFDGVDENEVCAWVNLKIY